MARFAIKITMTDGTVVDDVYADMPDETVPYLVGAAEAMRLTDADGALVTGGRAVTFAVRQYLTAAVREYAERTAADQARALASQQVATLVSGITIVSAGG